MKRIAVSPLSPLLALSLAACGQANPQSSAVGSECGRLPPAHGSRMGVCLPGGHGYPLQHRNLHHAGESNYYGHYPYEIEENYFSQDNLTTQPGEYRQTTVPVGSFSPNAFGLYDMHGNVGEWV